MRSRNPLRYRSVQADSSVRGLTLIELLVVMAILALLAAALLPMTSGSQMGAEKFSDRMALRWHFAQLQTYKQRMGQYPRKGGHQFVLAPWVDGIVPHTKANRDRYFSSALADDPDVLDVKSQKVEEIWKRYEDLSSTDTSYAGRALSGRRHMNSGKEIWMATDNEGGNVYPDGSVLILWGDGTVEELPRIPDQLEFGAPRDPDVEFCLTVGPDSPHPGLRKLRH